MPTGYTAKLYEGEQVTFPQFAMECARAFGALIEMRDQAPGVPIPDEFKPSPFYAEQHEKAKARIAEVSAWNLETAQRESQAAYDAEVARNAELDAQRSERRIRYEAMLAEAEAWQPPTEEHAGLKDFMVQQLRESIDFDCKPWSEIVDEPVRLPGVTFKGRELEKARADAARAVKYMDEEAERAKGRTEWVRALRASLPSES
jgi:hypothetical protein